MPTVTNTLTFPIAADGQTITIDVPGRYRIDTKQVTEELKFLVTPEKEESFLLIMGKTSLDKGNQIILPKGQMTIISAGQLGTLTVSLVSPINGTEPRKIPEVFEKEPTIINVDLDGDSDGDLGGDLGNNAETGAFPQIPGFSVTFLAVSGEPNELFSLENALTGTVHNGNGLIVDTFYIDLDTGLAGTENGQVIFTVNLPSVTVSTTDPNTPIYIQVTGGSAAYVGTDQLVF